MKLFSYWVYFSTEFTKENEKYVTVLRPKPQHSLFDIVILLSPFFNPCTEDTTNKWNRVETQMVSIYLSAQPLCSHITFKVNHCNRLGYFMSLCPWVSIKVIENDTKTLEFNSKYKYTMVKRNRFMSISTVQDHVHKITKVRLSPLNNSYVSLNNYESWCT